MPATVPVVVDEECRACGLNPRFCAIGDGGCGAPRKGQPFAVISYGTWLDRQKQEAMPL